MTKLLRNSGLPQPRQLVILIPDWFKDFWDRWYKPKPRPMPLPMPSYKFRFS